MAAETTTWPNQAGCWRLVEDGPSAGMLMDFGDLGRVTRGLHDRLDHTHLNDILDNPTSERVAAWVYDQARPQVEASGVRLAAVIVEETCTARCEYLAVERPE